MFLGLFIKNFTNLSKSAGIHLLNSRYALPGLLFCLKSNYRQTKILRSAPYMTLF